MELVIYKLHGNPIQKPTTNIQITESKEFKHNTKESHQITREKQEKKGTWNTTKTIRKQ